MKSMEMLIEVFRGVQIYHDAQQDRFTSNLVLHEKQGKKTYVSAPRLQQMRDEVEKFLNVSTKKPVVAKAWVSSKRDGSSFDSVEILCYNLISKDALVRYPNGNEKLMKLNTGWNNDYEIFLNCKENNAIIKELEKKQEAINKIKKETSCMRGKLIYVTVDHFVKK